MAPHEQEDPLDDGPGTGDDDLADEPLRGAPPDPLDRVWIHPAELPRLTGPDPRILPTARPPRRAARWLAPLAAGTAGAFIAVGTLALVGALDLGDGTPNRPEVPSTTPNRGLAVAVADLARSVVTVVATGPDGQRIASGVCLEHDGAIVTAARNVAGATGLEVVTADGLSHPARIDARDTRHGLAFLAVTTADGTGPAAAGLADAPPAVGDPVWLIGAGGRATAEPWMSTGLVSATTAVSRGRDASLLTGLVETDAVSPDGAVGGALVSSEGTVTAIVLGPSATGTTLAVPIAVVVAAAEAVAAGRSPGPAPIGVSLAPGTGRPVVTAVVPDGPAARAGLAVGDVITAADGRVVITPGDVAAVIGAAGPGTRVELEVRRGPEALRVRITPDPA